MVVVLLKICDFSHDVVNLLVYELLFWPALFVIVGSILAMIASSLLLIPLLALKAFCTYFPSLLMLLIASVVVWVIYQKNKIKVYP